MKLSLYNKLSWWYIFFTCTIITQPQKYLHLICILTKLCMSQSVFHVSMYTFIHICSNEYSFHFSIAFCMNNFFWCLFWVFCFVLFMFFWGFFVFVCFFLYFGGFWSFFGTCETALRNRKTHRYNGINLADNWTSIYTCTKNTSLNRLKALFVPYKTVFYVAIWHMCRSK